ncbi:hypothetical protein ACEN85_18750, partial [Curtobacterium sp. CT11-45]|uniref:hypothetical protein n=1 Tax=Curtobacterium sp. CT11-45 TaxID=3243037 RepID=UPI0039B011A6
MLLRVRGAGALEVVGLLLEALGPFACLGRAARRLGELQVRLVEVLLRLGDRVVVLLQVVLLGVVASGGEFRLEGRAGLVAFAGDLGTDLVALAGEVGTGRVDLLPERRALGLERAELGGAAVGDLGVDLGVFAFAAGGEFVLVLAGGAFRGRLGLGALPLDARRVLVELAGDAVRGLLHQPGVLGAGLLLVDAELGACSLDLLLERGAGRGEFAVPLGAGGRDEVAAYGV